MFAAIYRSYINPDKQAEYLTCWRIITTHFVNHCGAFGSTLHKTEEGIWVAYSRWPSKEMRDKYWNQESEPSKDLPQEVRDAIMTIRGCVENQCNLPEMSMEVVEEIKRKD